MIDGQERAPLLYKAPLRSASAAGLPIRGFQTEEASPFAHPSYGEEQSNLAPMHRLKDPASDAASLLLRLGFGVFALVIPSAALMSRWVIVVLVPIGAVLIILAGVIRPKDSTSERSFWFSSESSIGLWMLFLSFWAIISLLWTPFPMDAAEKLFKTLGVIALGYLAAASLPLRMRAPNLHLIAFGVAAGAVLLLWGAISAWIGTQILRFPSATPGRVAVMLSMLVWVAAAWMLIVNRRVMAASLVGLVCVAILVNKNAAGALIPLGIGLAVFIAAWFSLERVSLALSILAGLFTLLAPALTGLAKMLTLGIDLPMSHVVTRTAQWWDAILSAPLRIVTGRGFEAANAARSIGLIPPDAPVSFISDLWFELGLLGAMGLAALITLFFRHAGRMGEEVGPATLAGLAAAFAYAFLEQGATQTWWLNSMVVFALVLIGVERGRHRSKRPLASLPTKQVDEDG